MLVQDPTKGNDVDSIFNQARQRGVERPADNQSSRSRSFTGRGRLLSGEVVSSAPEHPEVITHTITFWQNGFTVDDGPLRRLDDPENAQFLEVCVVILSRLFLVGINFHLCYDSCKKYASCLLFLVKFKNLRFFLLRQDCVIHFFKATRVTFKLATGYLSSQLCLY